MKGEDVPPALAAPAETVPSDGAVGWVVDVIDGIGPLGVGLLIALENVFPPLPSEVILAFAGFSASQGTLSAPAAWVAATLGSLVGAYVLYGVGAAVGYDRLHELAGKRWFVLFSRRDLSRGQRFFERHGSKVVLLGRCVPLVRSVVSVPAGVARMPLWRFTWLTLLGSGVWNLLFIYLGYRLGRRWELVEGYVQPFAVVAVAGLAIGLLVLVVRRLRQRA